DKKGIVLGKHLATDQNNLYIETNGDICKISKNRISFLVKDSDEILPTEVTFDSLSIYNMGIDLNNVENFKEINTYNDYLKYFIHND
ncbi:MAG: hypothetical protein K8R68_00365, partial [Bacteroidales bacterium]|nr:hypothetical protein [Bacteroidales bacterium]